METAAGSVETLVAAHPFLGAVLSAASGYGVELRTSVSGNCLDLEAANRVGGFPNRARIRLFPIPAARPGEGRNRWAAFFYKRSNLPWSRERLSYGGVIFDPLHVDPDQVGAWIDYALSGFDPARVPRDHRRVIPYTVPE